MIPALYIPLDHLPLTPSGKIDRRSLPEPHAHTEQLGSAYTAPRNATEETLAAIWADVLGVEKVGVHDDFFELGGDSILSIQVVSRARQALGGRLSRGCSSRRRRSPNSRPPSYGRLSRRRTAAR